MTANSIEIWPEVNNANYNRFNLSEELDARSVKDLSLKYKVPISDLPAGVVDVYVNPSADEKYLYLSTLQSGVPDPQGLIMSIRRSDGKLMWQRQIRSYSNIDGDYTTAAPAVWEDFLFFGSSIAIPQTVAPFEGSMVGLFTGLPQKTTGRRVRVYCINKYTGNLVWETEIGQSAIDINDPDNWLSITQSPIVINKVIDASGVKRPIVCIGTSSLQSYLPWLMTRFAPFASVSWGEEYGSADGTPGGQMTDRGRVVFLNALSGAVMFTTYTCPDLLVTGDTLSVSSTIGVATSTITRHTVLTSDLVAAGDLNPITAAYGIAGEITYVLEFGGTIPSPLNGVNVVDATHTVVALVGGAAVTANLHRVVVTLPASLAAGTTNILINSNPFLTTDPAVGLDGTGVGLRPARIAKQINIGDTLTAEDAYQLNFIGCSVWGNSLSVVPGSAVLAVSVGQGHWYPYTDAKSLNDPGTIYLEQQQLILAAQTAFISNPTDINYQGMQLAYANYGQTILDKIQAQKSARGEEFKASSTIGISLKASDFGQIIWTLRIQGYDCWHIGMVLRVRSAFSSGWSDPQAYYERKMGADGDNSQGPYYINSSLNSSLKKKCKSKLYMLTVSKGAILTVNTVTQGVPTEIHRQFFGNTYSLGASNYGSTISGNSLYSLNSQAYDPVQVNAPLPSPQNFPPELRWYVSPYKFYDIRQSSVFKFKLSQMKIVWTVPVLPNDTAPYAMTLTQISSSGNLLYVAASNGEIHIKRLTDGKDVKILNVEHGGQSSPIVLDNELYAACGRSGLANYNLGQANYSATPYLYKFTVKYLENGKGKCKKNKCQKHKY